MRKRKPRALRWAGGKSEFGHHGTGRWVASLLPPPAATYTYLEPYSGMLGVLLQRQPARREIVSDLDEDLINWWRVVRDQPGELSDLLELTPSWSAAEFGVACQNLDHPDPVKRAYYFTLAVHWVRGGMIHRVRNKPKDENPSDACISRYPVSINEKWGDRDSRVVKDNPEDGISRSLQTRAERWRKASAAAKKGTQGRQVNSLSEDVSLPRSEFIGVLAERIRRVELEIRDAAWMVEYYASNPNLTMYLDPPYPSVPAGTLYSFDPPDVDEWAERLHQVEGWVAISGYGDEWAVLEEIGWWRNEHITTATIGISPGDKRPERVEVLWTNYDPTDFVPQPRLFRK